MVKNRQHSPDGPTKEPNLPVRVPVPWGVSSRRGRPSESLCVELFPQGFRLPTSRNCAFRLAYPLKIRVLEGCGANL